MRAMPKAMTSLAEVLVTSICDRPAKATDVTDAVEPGHSGLEGREPEHLLHVEGADEDEGVEARREQEPHGVGARDGARGGTGGAAAAVPRLESR